MSYSNLAAQASMVFDEVRNLAYLEAMRACIGPDTVVLDLGAGLGVLGLLAAKLGARRVYCVEPSPVGMHIPALAAANGVGDRVELVRGRIEEIELPEQVDVLLSVMTGTLLFTEGLMPSLYHARDRWLKPGGRMIPDRARLHFAAAEAAESHAKEVQRYLRPSLGIDYSLLGRISANDLCKLQRATRNARVLSTSCMAVDLDLGTTCQHDVRWDGRLHTTGEGVAHGLIGWIELRLGANWLSCAIDQPDVHWQPILLPVADPIPVQGTQVLDAGFRFVDDGQVSWWLGAGGPVQRQSTVMGNPDIAIDMILSSPDCKALPNADAEIVAQVLAAMQAGRSNREIASELLATLSDRFDDERQALKRVGALAARYRSHPLRKG
jgi:SAM-dependent methyltransferase